MQQTEKLLLMAGLGRELYGQQRIGNMVSSMAMVAMLTIVAAMLLGVALLLGIYAGFLSLVSGGFTPAAAMGVVALAALTLSGVVLLTLSCFLRKIKKTQRGPVSEIVEAFLDGLLGRKAHS